MIKRQLGAAYKVADDIMARIEQTSKLYSMPGQFDLMAKFYIEADAEIFPASAGFSRGEKSELRFCCHRNRE